MSLSLSMTRMAALSSVRTPLLKQAGYAFKTGGAVQPVFRFAPSPNGELHLGHAYAAILDFELCRAAGGRFLLRIEDIDPTRCRPDYEQAIYEDLAWLGITWELPVRRQSEHLPEYRAALARLQAMGLVYPSFESRAEIARLVAQREDRKGVV